MIVLAGCTSSAPRRVSAPPAAAPQYELMDGPPTAPFDVSAIPEPVPRTEPNARYGNHSPYNVLGKRYQVLPRRSGYSERGVASWYGTKFHGRLTSTREHIVSGKLRRLAALGDARAGGMPEVPTFIEQGVDVGRGWSGFIGLLGPARMPPHIHARLVEVFRDTMHREALRARLLAMDTDPVWLGPQDFGRAIIRVRDIWTELTRGMDLQLG